MAILAYNKAGLHHFTELLHDLYCPIPHEELKPLGGVLQIRFRDEERIICQDRISEFQVCVFDVVEVTLDGRPQDCPDPVQLNKLKCDDKSGVVIFEFVHPLQLKCRVERIHLELDQLV